MRLTELSIRVSQVTKYTDYSLLLSVTEVKRASKVFINSFRISNDKSRCIKGKKISENKLHIQVKIYRD
jgi:hypothetical protein